MANQTATETTTATLIGKIQEQADQIASMAVENARLKRVEENYDELREVVSETLHKLCETQNRQTDDAITAQVKKWEDR
jgi:DNA-binding Xre family transcriptional regulator